MSALVNKVKEVVHGEHTFGGGGHLTSLGNKLDPAVNTGQEGFNSTKHDTAGGYGTEHDIQHGTHHANESDPSYATGTHHAAQHTARPHKSDTLNKLDPRVDSDLDGSNTVGREMTSMSKGSNLRKADTHDAARVPPSIFAAHHGEPLIAHDDHKHNRAGRHGSATMLAGPDNYGSGME
ncbi:MAG: hypothetical protein M1813_008095 [Trichoglossum hirsutum]|nr:MAG: hypothetical protein M1813_008095 [Trichoglossum hirsutum]